MWKLSVEDDQGNKTTVNLVREEYTVGRAQENTVRLTERNISRRHALLRKNGAGWVLEDQSSYNGCYVNGARVCDLQTLEHGDLVQLGDYRLRIMNEAADVTDERIPTQRPPRTLPAPDVAVADAPPPSKPDRLIIVTGPSPGTEFALDRDQLIVGRGEECDVSINHSSVSRVHAEILRSEDGGFELIDQESANGVRVNGQDLTRGPLQPHATVELGDITLKFVPAGEEYDPALEPAEALPLGTASASFPPPVTASGLGGLLARVPLSPNQLKVGGAAVGVIVVALIAGIALGGGSDGPNQSQTAKGQMDDASQALTEAKALLDHGNVLAAHEMAVTSIPERHSLRESDDFHAIEGAWADSLLKQAARESDTDRKRQILERIAKATTVDSTRRKRAADELAQLSAEGVDIDELPPVKRVAAKNKDEDDEKPPPAPGQEEAATQPESAEPPPPRKRASVAKTETDDPYGEEPEPAPAPKPAAKPPSGGSTTAKATSGDRSAQIAAKDALKAKVASGRGTDRDKRLLRALCRQYNDASCAN